MRFRTKPFEIEATQFFKAGDHPSVQYGGKDDTGREFFSVLSMQGRVPVNPGDWIVTELDGISHYPCNPDTFAAKYDPVTS